MQASAQEADRNIRAQQDDDYKLALAIDRLKDDEKQIKTMRAMAVGGLLQVYAMLGDIMQAPEVQVSLQTWQKTLDFEKQQNVRAARIAAFKRKT